MPSNKRVNVETIEFNGIKFRRYPDSKNWSDKMYYKPNGACVVRGVGNLHQEIWKSVHGEIPDGCEIHHTDKDSLNNSIGNLECIPVGEHKKLHSDKSPEWRAKNKISIAKAIEAARRWSHSVEGMARRKELAPIIGKLGWLNAKYKKYNCLVCGNVFESRDLRDDKPKFCSNNCKSAWRRRSHTDDVARICALCGNTFRANKYSKTKFCSGKCGARSRSKEYRNGLQSNS